ncbi:ABC-2 type transport system permease protein [Cytobacillus purgationiresistens]|uniref:ABC-2 type transport system permease protein n=1 Tax=Cytobacillus purgationiresistens TaxID=863449 RepID=A0ABU0AMF8_9BACI|nr:ABC-2 type transport system permease protein [Cytobacillus purgationiresistens]
MNSWSIFLKRLRKNSNYQFRVFRSVADWTVVIYILLPAALIAIFNYYSWWMEAPKWIEGIPFFLIFSLMYAMIWAGNLRTYVEEADKVFLIRQKPLFMNMKKWAYGYTIVHEAVGLLISFLLLLPMLLYHYQLYWLDIILLLLFLLSLKSFILLIKYHLRKIEHRWKKLALQSLVFLILGVYSILIFQIWQSNLLIPVIALSCLTFMLSIIFSLKALLTHASIEHEIAIHHEERTKNIDRIFMMAQEIGKPRISNRKKPLFWKKSKRIFRNRTPVNGFAELFIKAFIRNHTYWLSYTQIISVCTAAIVIIPPLWIKVLMFFIFLIWLHSWLVNVWDQIYYANLQVKKYVERDDYYIARTRAVRSFMVLGIILLTFFVTIGLSIFAMMQFVDIQSGLREML